MQDGFCVKKFLVIVDSAAKTPVNNFLKHPGNGVSDIIKRTFLITAENGFVYGCGDMRHGSKLLPGRIAFKYAKNQITIECITLKKGFYIGNICQSQRFFSNNSKSSKQIFEKISGISIFSIVEV